MSSKLYLLPLSIFIIFPVTFATTYAIAVGKDHIYAFFSYISDTGTFPPEMNVFAQMLNIAGVIMGFTAYVRYKQVEEFFRGKSTPKIEKINRIGLIFGMIAALGSSVVGNFQESNVLSVHVIGAFMAFGGGSIFLIFQSYFSFKLLPLFGNKALASLRMAIGVTCLTLFIISYSTGMISMKHFTGDKAVKWNPEDGAWGLRVTSTVTEWVMASLFDIYFLTLVPEYKKITIVGPKFAFVNTIDTGRQNGQGKVVMQRVEDHA